MNTNSGLMVNTLVWGSGWLCHICRHPCKHSGKIACCPY